MDANSTVIAKSGTYERSYVDTKVGITSPSTAPTKERPARPLGLLALDWLTCLHADVDMLYFQVSASSGLRPVLNLPSRISHLHERERERERESERERE